ncbi:MAG: methyltransferase domain-containing protein [Candidatus Pseudobacter hemicellulosilyticus]|uniref:Methyltransferase domain-containing protein n=1 Tax=Candidatus Pseudobacter hemicellulosilyticus TaxID=3121375 RepID=A0AAJ5WVJ0_9BACT|nr:MAG: methyltransferase domain-containing protein [Pseudobacter sp.]
MTDASYWDNRYQRGETGWDLGAPSTPLKTYIDQLTDKELAILIPGCGNSYEAEYLLEQGFTNVTLIDISPTLTARLSRKFEQQPGRKPTIITGDFFALNGQFDLILEQTFFCALDPALRPAYVEQMHKLLKPGGQLAGVLFNRDFDGGPPFGGHTEEYEQLFGKFFTIRTLAPCYNSIKPREGNEAFIIAEKPS